MKIIVENTVCLNTGDAAILLAIRHILRSTWGENLRFLVFDSQPAVAARLYPDKDYPDIEFHKLLSESVFKYRYDDNFLKNALKPPYNRVALQALRHFGRSRHIDETIFSADARRGLAMYREADLVVTTGGTYLVETYNLEKRLNQFRIDAILGKDPVFFTQSLGPFNKSYNRDELKPILDRSPLILLRDARSLGHIRDLVDDPEKCHVVADAVFALADTDRISGILASKKPAATTGRVAISVRHWNYVKGGGGGMDRYIDSIRKIVTALVREHAKEVTFISTCQGVPEYAHDDSKTARAIVAGLDPDVARHIKVDASFHTPEQLMTLVRDFDFVVATRMHMMIMSLCVGTPVLPIAYEFKTRELAKRIGVSDVLLDIDTITAEEASEKLNAFIGNLEHYRSQSLQAVLQEYASAMSVTELLRPLLTAPSADGAGDLGQDGGQGLARLREEKDQDQRDRVV
ncbi:colanic acid biosynthesis glycosyl transferase [Phyllobacterium phragmitis]|uniref:Colanic acid biosynthesis glycosyl transferase n=1 Tax=Phyllobacterium phragmitis TaxID=2670329 RepID=A0A2S9IW07_9HYPH|nr:polysaccharide pyruvyl transferase family protein [Phyllobacterium phragmitis]PRD44711.1 colanic acid biosynthesis glycosyl transferase [Phyllobacterium phragmitis]